MISTSQSQESFGCCIAFSSLKFYTIIVHAHHQLPNSAQRHTANGSGWQILKGESDARTYDVWQARGIYIFVLLLLLERRRIRSLKCELSVPTRWNSTANVALITVNICALKANTQMHEADRERKRKKQQCWVHKHFDKQKQKKNSISKIKSCQFSWLLFYFRFSSRIYFFPHSKCAHVSPSSNRFNSNRWLSFSARPHCSCRSKSHIGSWVSRTLINRQRMHCKCLFAVEWYTRNADSERKQNFYADEKVKERWIRLVYFDSLVRSEHLC